MRREKTVTSPAGESVRPLDATPRRTVAVIAAVVWMALVLGLYYWVHKPLTPALAVALGGALDLIARKERADQALGRLDGITLEYEDWWCNVRPSNTEPLLRLNVEGKGAATMADVRPDSLQYTR